jgi:hypothetical protein
MEVIMLEIHDFWDEICMAYRWYFGYSFGCVSWNWVIIRFSDSTFNSLHFGYKFRMIQCNMPLIKDTMFYLIMMKCARLRLRAFLEFHAKVVYKDFNSKFFHNFLLLLSLGFEQRLCSSFSLEKSISPSFFSPNLHSNFLLVRIKQEIRGTKSLARNFLREASPT